MLVYIINTSMTPISPAYSYCLVFLVFQCFLIGLCVHTAEGGMHIYSKDQQAFHLVRTRAEKWFSRANTLLFATQLACFLSSVIRTSIAATASMSNAFFIRSDLRLKEPYLHTNCVYQVDRHHAFFRNVQYQVNVGNVEYFVSRSVLNLRYLFAVTGVYTLASGINRIFFETNTHELRYHFVIFRKDTVTAWEMLLLIMGIVLLFGVNEEHVILQRYLEACNREETIRTLYNYIPPFVELFVLFFVSLGLNVINALVAVWNLSMPNPRVVKLKAEREQQERMQEFLNNLPGDNRSDPRHPSAEASLVTYAHHDAPIVAKSDSHAGEGWGSNSEQQPRYALPTMAGSTDFQPPADIARHENRGANSSGEGYGGTRRLQGEAESSLNYPSGKYELHEVDDHVHIDGMGSEVLDTHDRYSVEGGRLLAPPLSSHLSHPMDSVDAVAPPQEGHQGKFGLPPSQVRHTDAVYSTDDTVRL